MTSLIIETELFLGTGVDEGVTQFWSMEDEKKARDTCEKSVVKAYLYLLDQHTGEKILVEAFE